MLHWQSANCSTHRRQICIRTEKSTVTHTAGYSSTGPIHSFKRVLCDDSLALKPTFSKKRELVAYCTKTLNRIESNVAKVAALM